MSQHVLKAEPVGPQRHQELIDFIYREFFPREKLAMASGLDKKTNPATVETFRQWLSEDLSLVVIDSDSIVGAAINCTVERSKGIIDYSCLEPEDEVIWRFLDTLEENYDPFERLQVERGLELVFLCVQDSHAGRGLARQLTEATVQLARERGFHFVKSNPSTPVTCHIYNSLGFITVRQMKLVDFTIDGRAAFPHATAEDSCGLSFKKL